jgi:hypothetical protein
VRAIVVQIEVGVDVVGAHGRDLATVVRLTTIAAFTLGHLFAMLTERILFGRKNLTRSGLFGRTRLDRNSVTRLGRLRLRGVYWLIHVFLS